jgi:hypothetical protein
MRQRLTVSAKSEPDSAKKSSSDSTQPVAALHAAYSLMQRFGNCFGQAEDVGFCRAAGTNHVLDVCNEYAGKSVYPFAPVGEYQSSIGAGSASGHPFLNRCTRSGLLMKGHPKAIRSAWLAAIMFFLPVPVTSSRAPHFYYDALVTAIVNSISGKQNTATLWIRPTPSSIGSPVQDCVHSSLHSILTRSVPNS